MNKGSGEKDIQKFSFYLFIFLWDVQDDYESGDCSNEGKDDNKEVNNVVPRWAAEEDFRSKNNNSHDNL